MDAILANSAMIPAVDQYIWIRREG